MTVRKPLRQGVLPLLIISLLCASILTLANHLTRKRIEINRQQAALKIITEVMPLAYTNDLFSDSIEVTAPAYLGTDGPVSVYRARRSGAPLGLIFLPVTAKGYNGPIELAIGVSYTGTLLGVRIHRHRETKGLGDGIHQDRSDWILDFDKRSLQNTAPERWAVKADGGNFDQLSGATITPRGVIKAVKSTLDYYAINRELLYQ